jgi:hypothetical protein
MNLQQLLEQAHLDALGMLDPEDRGEFNKAFATAPAAVREAVREEQSSMVMVAQGFLPDVDPTNALRERVIADISARMLAAEAGELLEEGSNPQEFEFRSSNRVSRMWRAGAIGLLGVCAVLGAAFVNVLDLNTDMKSKISDTGLPKQVMVGLGADRTNETLFDARTSRGHFVTVKDGFTGVASILHNAEWKDAVVSCKDLPAAAPGVTYELVVLGTDGKPAQRIANLGSGGTKGVTSVMVASTVAQPGTTLAIITTPTATSTEKAHEVMLSIRLG